MARDVIVVPILKAQDLPRRNQPEVDVRGSAVAIVELNRVSGACRLCDYEKVAEGFLIVDPIGTFPQVLVFAEETDQKHRLTFLGQHAKD